MTDLGLFNFGLSEQADEHLVHLVSQVGTGAIPVVGDECPGVFWVIGRIISHKTLHCVHAAAFHHHIFGKWRLGNEFADALTHRWHQLAQGHAIHRVLCHIGEHLRKEAARNLVGASQSATVALKHSPCVDALAAPETVHHLHTSSRCGLVGRCNKPRHGARLR